MAQFVDRQAPVFEQWRQSGAWKQAHPWMEVLLPWKEAAGYVDGILSNLPPDFVAGGRSTLWTLTRNPSPPMFKRPRGERVMGFGVLCAVPRPALERTLPVLRKASDLAIQVGGKRYLSSWVDFNHDQWVDHFGATWETVLKRKSFFDPKSILNPGFMPLRPPHAPA